MSLNVIQNTSTSFNITPYLNSRGWTVDLENNSYAEHVEGMVGDIEFKTYVLLPNRTYDLSLKVENMTSGTLEIWAGETLISTIGNDGYHQSTFTPTSQSYLLLRTGGNLRVSDLQIKLSDSNEDDLKNSTVTWSEQRKGWVTFKDFIPEQGFSMYTKLYTLKDGRLWAHDDVNNYNNFYGVQYKSSIKFPVTYASVQTFDSIAIHANKIIGTTENGVETQLGNVSDLITFDFDSREGIHYANLLADKILNDRLKGRYIVVELTDEESQGTKLQIFKIVLKSTQSTVNE